MSLITIILTLAALVASIISAIVGMAGGIVLLGVMSALLVPSQVVPLHGLVQLASNSTRTIAFARHTDWRILSIYALPLAIGVWLATLIWSGDKMDWFRPVVGGLILAFLLWRRFKPKLRNLPQWSFAPLGLVMGFATIFVGATGPLIAPFFLRDDFKKEQVIATKAACQTWGHVLKIPAFLSLGFDYRPHWELVAALIAAVILGTLVGKRLLAHIPERAFTLFYQIVLALVALYLIGSSFVG